MHLLDVAGQHRFVEWGKDTRKVACVGQLTQVLSLVSETFDRPRNIKSVCHKARGLSAWCS